MTPERAIQVRGLKKSWVAGQMHIHPSTLSRLLSGERLWDARLQRLFALAVGIDEAAICFVSNHAQDVSKACTEGKADADDAAA